MIEQKNDDVPIPAKSQAQLNYENIVSRIAAKPLRANIIPVHIWREENGKKFWHCTGIFLRDRGDVVTCAHAFWDIPGKNRQTSLYYYQILQPFESKLYPIEELQEIKNVELSGKFASKDVVICKPGVSKLISPLVNPEIVNDEQILEFRFSKYPTPIRTRSTVTGEVAFIIGMTEQEGNLAFSLLAYNSSPGESGTAFLGDSGHVYFISKATELTDELRNLFGLDKSIYNVALCSSISIK